MCCSDRLSFIFCCGLAAVLTVFPGCGPRQSNSDDPKTTKIQKSEGAEMEEGKLLRHVVLFQFKESSSKDDVRKVVDTFRELPSKISEIADFEWGVNNSPEGLDNGLTHGFVISFKSEKDRQTYLDHSEHKAFVDVLLPHLEKPVVLDFWAGK